MALRFNNSDDEYFANLVASGTIAGKNPLIQFKPSSLNLTSNCWATGDILHIMADVTDGDEDSQLQALSNDLRSSLPDELAKASTLSIFEYLMTLRQLPSFLPVLSNTFQNCNQTGSLHAPESDVNFTQDCSMTGQFWQRNVVGENWTDVNLRVSLFRSSLPAPFSTMSNRTLEFLGFDTITNGCSSGKECFRPPFQSMFDQAAEECASDACGMLDYSGNADIAGSGAVVVYGFITTVITCLAVTALYYHYRPEAYHTKFRKTIVETSIIVADAVFWLALMALVAGYVYIAFKANSNYEFTMAHLVTWLFIDAGLLSFLILLSYRKDISDSHFFDIRVVTLLIFMIMSFILFVRLAKLRPERQFEFVDIPCYVDGSWPSRYLAPGCYIQLLIYSVILFLNIANFIPRTLRIGVRFSQRPLHDINVGLYAISIIGWLGTILLLIGLWYSFCIILKIKAHARVAFGSSFEDDALGYGQIMACGFGVQALFTFIDGLVGHLRGFSCKRLLKRPQPDEELQSLENCSDSIELTVPVPIRPIRKTKTF